METSTPTDKQRDLANKIIQKVHDLLLDLDSTDPVWRESRKARVWILVNAALRIVANFCLEEGYDLSTAENKKWFLDAMDIIATQVKELPNPISMTKH